jgi:cytoskeletal protein RodZ
LRSIAVITLACLFATGAWPVTVDKKTTTPSKSKSAAKSNTKTTSKTAAKSAPKGPVKPAAKSSAKKPATTAHKTASKSAPSKTASKKGGKKAPAQSWRARQQAPTPDRYKQIQEALAAKGYLKSSPSGVWNGESTDALRRFQADQKLEPSGKLNSLSLIALGLGPRRDTASVPPPQAR